MYSENNITIVVQGRLVSVRAKISNDSFNFGDVGEVKGLCFVKSDGTDSKIHYWTTNAVNNAIEMANDILQIIGSMSLQFSSSFVIQRD